MRDSAQIISVCADNQGQRIMAMLNLTDSWVTKVEKEELEEFGGY